MKMKFYSKVVQKFAYINDITEKKNKRINIRISHKSKDFLERKKNFMS